MYCGLILAVEVLGNLESADVILFLTVVTICGEWGGLVVRAPRGLLHAIRWVCSVAPY